MMSPVLIAIHVFYLKEQWQFGSFVYHSILYFYPDKKLISFVSGVCFDIWFILYITAAIFLMLQVNLSFMFTVKTTIVKIMALGLKKNTPQKRLEEQFVIYSQLRILKNLYNNVFGKIFIPGLKLTLGIMVVQSVFVTVRLASKEGLVVLALGILGGIVQSVVLLMFIGFTALVNDYSKQLLMYIRRNEGLYTKYGRLLMKSYKIIAVTSGGMYNIEQVTCLTVLGIISNVCGSVLISIKI